ncbi:MAG: sugar phosphate nucleotidyltransferase [Blastocatellia bacterium]
MKAMILAAGFGARLWPLTVGRTKPAIPFLNRPLIAFTIDYLRRFGVTDLIINLHHEPASVRDQIGDGSRYGVRIEYSVEEPEILGTSGALDRVRDRLERETFLVVNGKIITDLDLGAALETHRRRQALATLALRPNPKRERFSEILLTEDGRIAKFGGFPTPGREGTPLMFTGIHILEPAIFEYIPRDVFSDSVRDVYPKAMAEGRMIAGHVGEGAWYELSTLDRYLAISLEFLGREGRDVVMDAGCRVAPDARIERSVLWKRVRVESGAVLTDCVVGDDVTIPAYSRFSRAVIFRADRAPLSERPEKAMAGTVVDGLLVVPLP